MRADDIPQVREIDRASFAMPWPEKAYHHEISDETRSLALVAELTGGGEVAETASQGEAEVTQRADAGEAQVVGLLVVWLILDEAHIATLAVHPDYRGLGISRQLLALGLKQAIGKGARIATLEVRAGNQVAQQLYRSFLFKVAGRRIRYYRDNNEDALIMNRDLLELKYYPTGYPAWLDRGEWRQKRDENHDSGGKIFDNIDISQVE